MVHQCPNTCHGATDRLGGRDTQNANSTLWTATTRTDYKADDVDGPHAEEKSLDKNKTMVKQCQNG